MSQTQVASVLGVSSTAISKWRARGCPRLPDGAYDLGLVCRWILKGACDITRLPQVEIVKLLAVTKPTLSDWEKKGLPRNGDGSYDATKAVPWRLARLEEKASESRQLSEMEREKLRSTRIANKLAEIELAEKRGEMLSRPATVAGWVARVQVIKSAMLSMVGRISGLGLTDEQIAAVKAEALDAVRRFAAGGVLLQLDPAIAAKVDALIASEIIPPAPAVAPVVFPGDAPAGEPVPVAAIAASPAPAIEAPAIDTPTQEADHG